MLDFEQKGGLMKYSIKRSHLSWRAVQIIFTGFVVFSCICTSLTFGHMALNPDTPHPAVLATDGGKLEVFVRGKNDHLVRRRFRNSKWGGWENLGGDLRGHLWKRIKVLTHNVYGVAKNIAMIGAKRSNVSQPTYGLPITSLALS